MRQLPVVQASDYEAEVDACAAFLEALYPSKKKRRDDFDEFRSDGELFFAHFPNIGTTGLLLERATGKIWALGSAHPLETYLWAYDRGFRDDKGATLTITRVHDIDGTFAVLRRWFHAPYIRAELLPRLSSPPVAIELDSSQCWATLQTLQDTQAFEFEVS
jgi:hypothetical protein